MKRVGLVVFPNFQILDLVAISVFEVANAVSPVRAYDVHLLSENGGPVVSSAGVPVETKAFSSAKFDTVLVTGWLNPQPSSPGLIGYMRAASTAARRIGSICTGAFILAEAGLLDGRRVTTHWALARELQRRYPKARVEEDRIYIEHDHVWSSAGMSPTQ